MERQVVVTGAGSGIGLATAIHLAQLGFAVIGLVPDPDERRLLDETSRREGVGVDVLEADLADPSARGAILASVRPWALVNNAGYMNAGRIMEVPIRSGRRQLEVMVVAPVDLALQALPRMLERGDGRIVNITSSAAHTSTPLTGWYQASKAALRELNDALRVELRGSGVEVIDVEPGGYRTGIWRRAESELRRRGLVSDCPEMYGRALRTLRRAYPLMPGPGEVAKAVGDALTTGHPPSHVRVGRGSYALRVASESLPDWAWDRLVSRLARAA